MRVVSRHFSDSSSFWTAASAVVTLIAAAGWSVPVAAVTSLCLSIILMIFASQVSHRLLALICTISCAFLIYDRTVLPSGEVLTPASIQRDMSENWIRSVDYYRESIEDIADELSGNHESKAFFSYLAHWKDSLIANARQMSIPAVSRIALLDSTGNIEAWAGDGFEMTRSWPAVSKNASEGIEPVFLPAGLDYIFWRKLPDGKGLTLNLPVVRYPLKSGISPDNTVLSFFERNYPVHFLTIEARETMESPETDRISLSLPVEGKMVFSFINPRAGPDAPLKNFSQRTALLLAFASLILFFFIIASLTAERFPFVLVPAAICLSVWTLIAAQFMHFPERLGYGWLSDTRLYAGSVPLAELPGEMLLMVLCLYSISLSFRFKESHRQSRWTASVIFAALCGAVPGILDRIIRYFIINSSIEWWPAIPNSEAPGSIIIGLAVSILMYVLIRLVLWAAWISIPPLRVKPKDGIPGALLQLSILLAVALIVCGLVSRVFQLDLLLISACLASAGWGTAIFIRQQNSLRISVISVMLMGVTAAAIIPPLASDAVRQAVRDSLFDWVADQDQTRTYALKSNLLALSTHTCLPQLLNDPESTELFCAYHLWNRSDLSAVTRKYAVEIRDTAGSLIDRFSPDMHPAPLPPQYLDNVLATPGEPIILPYQGGSQTIQPELIGGIAISSGEKIQGTLIIRLPAGPGTALPSGYEWGFRATAIMTSTNESLQFDSGIPVNQAFLNSPSGSWIRDETNNRQMMTVWLPRQERIPGEAGRALIAASIPFTSFLDQASGLIYLLLLIALPAIPYFLFTRMIPKKPATILRFRTWNFRNQLFIAFAIFAGSAPLILAITLHRVFDEITHRARMDHLNRQSLEFIERLNRTCIDFAGSIPPAFSSRSIDSAGTPPADFPFVRYSNQGQIIEKSSLPLSEPPPSALVSEAIQTSIPRCYYVSVAPGLIDAVVLLPEPSGTEAGHAILAVEVPVTGEMIQSLMIARQHEIDIYTHGRIAASSRPELFNAGFMPAFLPAHAFTSISQEPGIRRPGDLRGDPPYKYYSVLRNGVASVSAILVLTTSDIPIRILPQTPVNLIIMIAVSMFAVGIVVSDILGRRLAAPVRSLTAGATEVSNGNLDVQIRETGTGELRNLIHHFNRMISEIALGHRRLSQRHQFIQTLLAEMSSGLVATDEKMRITMVNRAAETILGVNFSGSTPTDFSALFQHLHLEETADAIRTLLPRTGHVDLRAKLLKEGMVCHLRIVLARLGDPVSGITGYLAMIDDITAAIMSSKMEAYAELARRVAHEIKNPLTPVRLSIEHLRQTFDDGAADFPRIFDHCTTTVLDEVNALEKIATEFARFARMPKSVFQIGDLRLLLEEIKAVFSVPIPGIDISFHIPDNPLQCRFDHDQLKRVFTNLIHNGIQAMPEGGLMKIEAKSEGHLIHVSISDTGTGMDEVTVLKLFEPYFSTRKDGIGLGLVISKAAIDEHGGEIRVESTPGKGTVFNVILPGYDLENKMDSSN